MGNPKYVGWRTRMAVILRDKECVYCRRRVAHTTGASRKGNASWRAYDSEGNSFHFDHRRPFASGGTSGPENVVLACQKCNLSKGTANV